MSVRGKKIHFIAQRVRSLYDRERREKTPGRRFMLSTYRWILMLYHEFLRDDVKVRAESLAFLMVFSLLPLIAGAFFVFTIFTRFGFVQEVLDGSVESLLLNIPDAHRSFIRDYIIQFKDNYLESLSAKSGTVGIFALFILIWIGLQTFNNIDRMLNHIWSADRSRPFFEQVRNFLVVAIAAPMVLVSGLSVPLVLEKVGTAYPLLSHLPAIGLFLRTVLTPLLVLLTFTVIYRYVPVRPVRWKPALIGALFATVCFQITNSIIRIYFIYGTNSAYGKAAVLPLIGFWIYIIWIVVILGAEVSFLIQNEMDIIFSSEIDPTLREGGTLLALLSVLFFAHREKTNPVDFERLRAASGLTSARLHTILDFLFQRKLIVECVSVERTVEGSYALACDPDEIILREVLQDFYKNANFVPAHALDARWQKSLIEWFDSFDEVSLSGSHSKRKTKE